MAYFKVAGGHACRQEAMVPTSYLQELSADNMDIAKTAKQAAEEILRDALKKRDRVLCKGALWNFKYLNECEKNCDHALPFMKRYATVTYKFTEKLLRVMSKIKFKQSENPDYETDIAYVIPGDKTYTVHLCPLFWKAPSGLAFDSQPGTLIHEVSHFLGTKDVLYADQDMQVAAFGIIHPSLCGDGEHTMEDARLMYLNANSVEYEFEVTINHKEPYSSGSYGCCGETRVNSVCSNSVDESFLKMPCKLAFQKQSIGLSTLPSEWLDDEQPTTGNAVGTGPFIGGSCTNIGKIIYNRNDQTLCFTT